MSGLVPVCERCRELRDDCLVLITADGLVFEGEATEIEGSSVFTGEPVKIKFTEYGFEFYGDVTELGQIRGARCLFVHGTVSPAKEG